MWIQRTPEEIVKWQKAAEQEACSQGRLIGGLVWILTKDRMGNHERHFSWSFSLLQ
jgi:hypothetical protein